MIFVVDGLSDDVVATVVVLFCVEVGKLDVDDQGSVCPPGGISVWK